MPKLCQFNFKYRLSCNRNTIKHGFNQVCMGYDTTWEMYQRKPLEKLLKTFWCIVLDLILNDKRKKLDVRNHSHNIVGYSNDSKSYRLLNPFSY